MSEQSLEPGIALAFKGEALTYEETSSEVLVTYVLAFLIVFLVLAAQFENVNSAIVVMITVPFGITSAILALYLTGTSLNIYSQIVDLNIYSRNVVRVNIYSHNFKLLKF